MRKPCVWPRRAWKSSRRSASVSRRPRSRHSGRSAAFHVSPSGNEDRSARGLRTSPAFDRHLLARHLCGCDEELLELTHHAAREVSNVSIALVVHGHGDHAIVALPGTGLSLLLAQTNDPDRLRGNDHPRPGRRIEEDHRVEWIAVVRAGAREKAKVVGIYDAQEEGFVEDEDL